MDFAVEFLAIGTLAKKGLRRVWVRGVKWIGAKASGQRLIKRGATFTADPRPFQGNDNKGGTRGQLVGWPVQVQVANFAVTVGAGN